MSTENGVRVSNAVLRTSTGDAVNSAFSVDGFNRLRVSAPVTKLNSKQTYSNGYPLFVEDSASGGSSLWSQLFARSRHTVTSTIGSRLTRQSRQYVNYEPGKSHLVFVTYAAENGGEVGVEKRIGYFDNNNGVYLQIDENGAALSLRSGTSGSPVNRIVRQEEWNVDPMNGLGPSGEVLSHAFSNILVIDITWLGVGPVRIGFKIGSAIHHVHTYHNANVSPSVYMSTPSLPVRWEIETVGAGAPATSTLDSICCSVMSEAGNSPPGMIRSLDRGIVGQTMNNTGLWPLVSIRLNTTHRRATVMPHKTSVMSSTGANLLWQLLWNATIATPAWVPVANCAVDYDITNADMVTGGIPVASGYVSANNDEIESKIETVLGLTSDYAGNPDTFTLAVQKAGGGTDTVFGGISYEVIA